MMSHPVAAVTTTAALDAANAAIAGEAEAEQPAAESTEETSAEAAEETAAEEPKAA